MRTLNLIKMVHRKLKREASQFRASTRKEKKGRYSKAEKEDSKDNSSAAIQTATAEN